jgi:starch synthase
VARVPSVTTVHNLAYQGVFPAAEFGVLQLPADFFSVDGVEFYGHLSFLKAGLFYADRITTVSPTYAREIQTHAQGAGLDGLLRTRTHDISGILNGVDKSVWNPATDTAIHTQYSIAKFTGKAKCKAALQERVGLAREPNALLFGVVSRLTEQKGIDLLLSALPDIVQRGGQLVVLGTGDPALENGLKKAALAHPHAVAVELGFDETLSHSIIAGSDIVMVPSRFEPCGLTQLYALAYGSLPLVHCVGGLADTVVDASLENLADELATGFVFEKFDRPSIVAAIRRAFALKQRRLEWKAVVRRAMEQDFGWEASALRYVDVYRELIATRAQ